MKFKKVVVIGGTGDFGSWYAGFFRDLGSSVVITSRNEEFGRKKALDLGVGFSPSLKGALHGADLVVVCVPFGVVESVLKEVIGLAEEGALVVDFASVKGRVVRVLQSFSKEGLELASVHPMHGPRVSSVVSKPVVFVPVKAGDKYESLKELFSSQGARVVECSAKEHDEMLSVVQGLTHFAHIASARALVELNVDLKKSREFSSPVYELFLSTMARVVLQNPSLYANIQVENPQNERVREVFAKQVELLRGIATDGDKRGLERAISQCACAFKSSESVLFAGDKAVSALNAEVGQLKGLVGRQVALENIHNQKVHYGVVEKVEADKVVLLENSKRVSIKLSNTALLTHGQYERWREQNVKTKKRDYSIVVPRECDSNVLKSVFKQSAVKTVLVVDEYDGLQLEQGKKSVTLGFEVFEDEDLNGFDDGLKKIVRGLGFSLR
ncbi:MAG: prephenate dehydrogenase/arogenate dehydrogenase family protein [Candidatus Micrarchaeia archaeon]